MTIPSWCRAGAKVVCICDLSVGPAWAKYWMPNRPKKGGIYTIRACGETSDGPGMVLEEIRNPTGTASFDGESGFNIEYFRPLITRTQTQDVAQFKHLLTPSPADLELLAADLARAAANGEHV